MASMEALQPSSLQLRASWNGDINNAVCIFFIVEVETKPNSRLTLLNNVRNTGLSHSMLWQIGYPGQEVPVWDRTNTMATSTHETGDLPPSLLRKLFPSTRNHQDGSTKSVSDDKVSLGDPPVKKEGDGESIAGLNLPDEPSFMLSKRSSKIPVCKRELDHSRESHPSSSNVNASVEPEFDDSPLDMLPSPTPSSQDLFPWASTKEIVSRLEAEAEAESDELSLGSEAIVSPLKNDPDICCEDGQLVLHSPSTAKKGMYRAEVVCFKHIYEGQDKWLNLDLAHIMMACPEVKGTFVFDGPPGYDFEFAGDLHNAQATHGHLEYEFTPRELQFTPFRLCKRKSTNNNEVSLGDAVSSKHSKDGNIVDRKDSTKSGVENPRQRTEAGKKHNACETTEPVTETAAGKKGFFNFNFPTAEEFREKQISVLRWLLPLVFWGSFFFFLATGGPPESISTPTNTWRTVHGLARNISIEGYSRLQTMICPTVPRSQNALDIWREYEIPSTISQSTTFTAVWSIEDPSGSGDLHSVTQGSASFEANQTTDQPDFTTRSSNEEALMVNDRLIEEDSSSTKTLPTNTITGQATDAQSAKEDILPTTLPNNRGMGPRNDRVTRKSSFSMSVSSLAWKVFSHVACSTSSLCIIAVVSEDHDPQWEVFERYFCDENRSWRPYTTMDHIDHYLGWTPPECGGKD